MTRAVRDQSANLQIFQIGTDEDPDVRAANATEHDVVLPAPPALRRGNLFERLVAPRSAKGFLSRIWNQRSLRLRSPRRSRWAKSLLGSDGIERLLETRELPLAAVRVLFPSGASRPLTHAAEASFDLLTGGRALVFHDLHVHAAAVRKACVGLSNELGIPVRASAYLLPPGVALPPSSSAFARFLVQLEGSIRTTIDEGGEERSFTGAPGDVLYLRRNVRHRMQSGRLSSSLVLALEIHELSAFDLMKRLGDDALRRCSEDLTFRRSCATTGSQWTSEDRAYLDECLRRFGAAFRLDDLDDVREDLYLDDAAEIAASAGRFSYGQLLTKLRPSTVLERRPALFFTRRTDQHLILKLAGKQLLFPHAIAEALAFVTTQERFRIDQIPGRDARGKLTFAQKLLREGFLIVAKP